MSTQNWEATPGEGDELDARQIEEAHVRESEEESRKGAEARRSDRVEHHEEIEDASGRS
jgi:hypothetical protein